jgi:outer membrane lipoprotein-sorting protein
MKRMKWILPAILVAGMAYAQDAPKPAEAPAGPKAKEILQKTLTAYSSAKTYQGFWSFTIERGEAKNMVSVTIKSKLPSRLYFRVAPVSDEKPTPGREPVPEMLVVVDGKNAYFQNANAGVYYKVTLPKGAQISPLMFIPQIPAAGQVELKDEKGEDGKAIHALEAETVDGEGTRMEISPETFRIRRILAVKMIGATKDFSTIIVYK